ncbi:MAG TPA: hypothetical protein GX390_00785 [Acholeplasmataceae bacterium]|jgi:membrane-associated phospholipid phosphatase|nr:hypothetical protein [Acholeplasmataceae bacterium]
MFDNFNAVISSGLPLLGAMAFIVSVITEVIKETKLFKKVPTDLVVIALSLILTVTAYFALAAIYDKRIIWYEVVASVVVGFFVAFVAMFGWSKLDALFTRFRKTKE